MYIKPNFLLCLGLAWMAEGVLAESKLISASDLDGLLRSNLALKGTSSGLNGLKTELFTLATVDKLNQFASYMKRFAKLYHIDQLSARLTNYLSNMRLIDVWQKAFDANETTYTLSENEYTDMSEGELKSLLSAGIGPEYDELVRAEPFVSTNVTLTGEPWSGNHDWRSTKCVQEPRKQGNCGSCYAFAVIHYLETFKCMAGQHVPRLSAQQVLDCATEKAGYMSLGCGGGYPIQVLRYFHDTDLVASEECYPYKAHQNYNCNMYKVEKNPSCVFKPGSKTDSPIKHKILASEAEIIEHLNNHGPVISTMSASYLFFFYGKGIYSDYLKLCEKYYPDVNHAIVLIGYGKDNKGTEYWLAQNSWGSKWGEKGFFRIKRGLCNVGRHGYIIV